MNSNRGYSKTCTINSIAKAICAYFPNDDLDTLLMQDSVNQIFEGLDGVFPEEYNGKGVKVRQVF